MKATFQIVIPKRMTACFSCQKPFLPMQEIVSELVEWNRKDFCSNCFNQAPHAITWKQKYQEKASIEPEDQDEIAKSWELLQKNEDPEVAYILTLYLARKKILAKRGNTGLYEHLETGEMVMIPDIDFKKLTLPEVHRRLQDKLK